MALEMILMTLFFLFILLLIFASIGFYIWMLVDSIMRDYEKNDEKLVWILLIVFTQVIGAIIYFFVVKLNDKKKKK